MTAVPETPTPANTAARTPRIAWLHLALLTAACVACLAPFADKAFHIDDPLFVWTAQQIRQHLRYFYGFRLNWYYTPMNMADVTKNPPLASYYLALVGPAFAWAEVPLHLAFLVWAVGAVWGTYRLAERFCTRPLLAALATLLTPVFLVSGTGLMCDTMMLCLWVWAVLLWDRGLDGRRSGLLCLAALLVALCALTKYFGISLIPLLVVYSLVRTRRIGAWLWPLLIPVLILVVYQVMTQRLYGRGLLLDAVGFARDIRSHDRRLPLDQLIIGLAFVGGCVPTALWYAPLVWSRRALGMGLVVGASFIVVAALRQAVGPHALADSAGLRWPVIVQAGLFGAAGIGALALAVADLAARRDSRSLVLFLWVFGTFIFATFLNWTVNARSILPMVPAVGILLMRRLDDRRGPARAGEWAAVGWPLVPAAVLALLVTWADYRWANTARTAAGQILERYRPADRPVLFQGHWGFQYYMERVGARVMNLVRVPAGPGDPRMVEAWRVRLRPGDTVIAVVPSNNWPVPGVEEAEGLRVTDEGTITLPLCSWLSTSHKAAKAGFYAEQGYGPLPYAFGPVPPDEYHVFRVTDVAPSAP